MISQRFSRKLMLAALLMLAGTAQSAEEPTDIDRFTQAGFGLGLTLTVDTGRNDRVDEASIVNDIVRVDKDSNVRARLMLEGHVWLMCKKKSDGSCDANRTASGPFISLQPGSEKIIDAAGIGWMWRFPDKLFRDKALNLGIGIVVDDDVQILGDGFEENQPPPPGETQVRFRNTDQAGVFIIASIDIL